MKIDYLYNKLALLAILIFLCGQIGYSQNTKKKRGLLADEPFFRQQEQQYKDWLTYTKLSNYFMYDTLEVHPKLIKLKLKIADLSAWKQLVYSLDTTNISNRSEEVGLKLYNKFLHIMEVPKDSVMISITSINQSKNDRVSIVLKTKNGVKKVYSPRNIRAPINDSLTIRLNNMVTLESDRVEAKLDEVKMVIIDHLKEYYVSKNSYWRVAKCTDYEEGNDIGVQVVNVKAEILDDCGLFCYFETIKFEISLTQEKEEVKMNYSLEGKYGSGIFVAPRRHTGYEDMETEEYQKYLLDYSRKMKSEIKRAIINKVNKP